MQNNYRSAARAISIVDDVEGVITGYVAIWGSPEQTDSYGTWFDKSRPPQMDLDLLPIALRYNHGMDGAIKGDRIGELFEIFLDDIGIGFNARIDKSINYFERIILEIRNGTADGPLRTSSGTTDYLASFRPDMSFENWPISEVSLTNAASEHRIPQVEIIRSQRVGELDGTDATTIPVELDESQEGVSNDGGDIILPQDNGEIQMEELLTALGLPPEATIEQVIAAIIALGVPAEDILAALDMQREPAAAKVEDEPERSDIKDAAIVALNALVASKQAEAQTAQEQHTAELETDNRNLRGKVALFDAKQSAPPANRQQTGDTTDGGNSAINGMSDLKFAHLSASQMAYGYQLLKSRGAPISDDYIRSLAGKTIERVERGYQSFKDPDNYQSMRSSIKDAKRADELMYTTNTGAGAEWIPQSWETALWESVRQNLIMDTLMREMMIIEADSRPGSTTYVPLEGSDPTFYMAAENKSVGDDLQPAPLVDPSQMGTAQVSVTPKKGMARVIISTELLEDSIIPVLAQLDRQFNRKFQEQIEYLFLNGDTETAASTNINLIDGTPPSGTTAPSYLITDGALKYALVTGTSTSSNGGVLTTQDFLDARGKMPNVLISDPAKLIYISDNRVQLKALALTDWKDISVSTMPTQESGTITMAWGSPYLASGQMALANSAGKLPTAAGTKGRLLCIAAEYWAMVWKRKVTFKTFEDIDTDTTKVVSSFRVAFQERSAGASTCIYNLTV